MVAGMRFLRRGQPKEDILGWKDMAVANSLQSKSIKKYVLQQSNCNLDAVHDREEDHKLIEKNVYAVKMKEDVALETENQCIPQKVSEKSVKSDAKKLRSVRLDLSSLKRGVIQKANLKTSESSEESSEDEGKQKKKTRPVVPNYVTNTESGPCRKPRQNRQDPLLLSSQLSPKASSQSLSIARRNARERNRVKQVNEGFATLRSRIPDYISKAYSEEKGRKTAKKLSKVETLRMAVDYIRHLEGLLDVKSTEKDVWKQIKMEDPPWDTPHSSEYAESPGPTYDQTFEYQDRIFYEYDLDFGARKEEGPGAEKKMATYAVLAVNDGENQCVDDFKYYETFNRIKKEGGERGTVGREEEGGEVSARSPEGPEDPEDLLLPKDVIRKKSPNVLPSITESFSKTIPVFF